VRNIVFDYVPEGAIHSKGLTGVRIIVDSGGVVEAS
jgi:hypothetical protein